MRCYFTGIRTTNMRMSESINIRKKVKEQELSYECKLVQWLWKTNLAMYSSDQDMYAL